MELEELPRECTEARSITARARVLTTRRGEGRSTTARREWGPGDLPAALRGAESMELRAPRRAAGLSGTSAALAGPSVPMATRWAGGRIMVPPPSGPTASTPTVGITMAGSTVTGAAITPPPGAGATRTGEAAGATGAGAWASAWGSAWGWATGWPPGATARPSTAWDTCRTPTLTMTTTTARARGWRWPARTITPSRSI